MTVDECTRPILVVDDDENNRDMLSRRLRKVGYAVAVAASAADALAVVEHTSVELILLDNMMPGKSGVELLRELRTNHTASDLPVIMVTAMNESKDVVEALRLGANDYITKPVDMAVALARIDSQVRRRRAEDDLAGREQRLSLAMRGTNDGMWDWDLRSGEVFYSARWKSMLGVTDGDVSTSPDEWLRRVHPDDADELRKLLTPPVGDFSSEHRIRHSNGAYKWVLCRAAVQRGPHGEAIRMAGCITDVDRSKSRDPLTGLPNRLAFYEHLQEVLGQYRAGTREAFAVCFVDLDRFKMINDSLGHAAGDELLMEVSRRLQSTIRRAKREGASHAPDAVARLGGDEFALVMENVSSPEQARGLGHRLLAGIAASSRVMGRELFTTASIGVVMVTPGYDSAQQLIRDADTAMYYAKGRGKNRCEFFDTAMHEDARLRLEIVSDMQRALGKGEFEVVYQPKIGVSTQRLAGFEALLRWHHSERGEIAPSQFIPIAEECGLIVPVGIWVLEEACTTMHRWHREYPANPLLGISVNLSVRQLRQPDLLENVEAILRRTGIAPGALQLEVTESILIDDPDAALRILTSLKALGIGLKIDDFGSGYSSLRQLADMPFDSLKIDRSFIERLTTRGSGEEMVRTIIAMARNLDIEVVAEGVETSAQFDKLALLGCDHVQGHYFSAALSLRDAESLIAGAGEIVSPAASRLCSGIN